MLRWRIGGGVVMLLGMLTEQGCLFKKAPPKASIVIPPAPQAQPPQPLPVPPQLPPSDAKPTVKSAPLPTLPPPVVATKPPRARPAKKPTATPPVVAAGTEVTPPQSGETPQTVPTSLPNPAPSLQPILGAKEIQERTQRIQQYLEKARLIVLRAERSNPNTEQKRLIAQVRTFLQQAEDARKVDLVRAENLAERAEVLSRGLTR